jgi:hypothetical protein
MRPISVNAHIRYMKAYEGGFLPWIKQLNPAVLVTMVDDNPPGKEDQTPYIQQLAAQIPHTRVVARVKHDLDGGFHTKPQTDPRRWVADPDDFLNKWGHLGKRNMSLYALNEPDDGIDDDGKVDPEKVKRLNEWCVAVMEKAAARDISVTIANFGTGIPAEVTRQWHFAFDPILCCLSKYRDLHLLGLHEYLPDEVFRVGRFRFMLSRCKELGIPPPRVIITEHGVDTDGGPRNGYRSRGWSGAQYGDILLDVYQRIYRPFVESGVIAGLCVFSYGNSGGWESFDVESDKDFKDKLLAAPEIVVKADPPSPQPPSTPPDPDPVPPVVTQPAWMAGLSKHERARIALGRLMLEFGDELRLLVVDDEAYELIGKLAGMLDNGI